MDRKEFLTQAFKQLIDKGLELTTFKPIVSALENLAKKKERPPGSVQPDEKFKQLCIGCDACMIACPVNVIVIEDLEKRYPLIYPEEAPCLHCSGYPCIQACHHSALLPNTLI
jgi:ferredoxin